MNVVQYTKELFGTGRSAASGKAALGVDMREFLAQSAIRSLLSTNTETEEDFMRSEMLLIFDTHSQHTWLIATNAALYCVTDNRHQNHPRKLWRIARSDIERDGKLIVQVHETVISESEAYIVINSQRPRKFTKQLFRTLSIKKSIENMICNAFQLQFNVYAPDEGSRGANL